MIKRSVTARALAIGLILSLQGLYVPAFAEKPAPAALSGTIVSSSDHAPLAGVKVHAADPRTGDVYSSEPTDAEGRFSIADLPATSYELGLESDGGLYLIPSPVALDSGAARQVTVKVAADPVPAGSDEPARVVQGKPGVWDNPLTAALIVVGAAFLVGIAIDAATDDDDPLTQSASNPGS